MERNKAAPPSTAGATEADLTEKAAPNKMLTSVEQRAETAARCHEVQVCLGNTDVPDFENVLEIGMAVRLALHLRGLPLLTYEIVKLVAVHYLGIPAMAVQRIVYLLEEVEFVSLSTEGKTIKGILPRVPYYQDLYSTLGEFASTERTFTGAEELSLEMLRRLARAPQNADSLRHAIGADQKVFTRALTIGEHGSFMVRHRTRGRDIVSSPTYFSENAETFADLVASSGSETVRRAMESVRKLQGVPLSLIESGLVTIDGRTLPPEEVLILTRLAQEGAIKPPSIRTEHAGEQHFLFTPTPTGAALPATKREIYERAMNMVAAVRQGQFLAKQYRIRSPGAVLYTLLRDGKLGRATTEAGEQYRNLVRHRVAQLVPTGGGYAELRLIDTRENREALSIALALVDEGAATGVEVDEQARQALQMDQQYLESILASGELRKRTVTPMNEDQQLELDMVLSLGGAS